MPISVIRKSDGSVKTFGDMTETTHVHSVKKALRAEFAPKFENGCRLMFQGKVMKSIHRLKHYGVKNNDKIEMEDTRNWSSSSSSSDEEK